MSPKRRKRRGSTVSPSATACSIRNIRIRFTPIRAATAPSWRISTSWTRPPPSPRWRRRPRRSASIGGVLKLPSRHPVLTAKAYASLAFLSNNRVSLGVGISPWKEDLVFLNVNWERRGKVMDECLEAIRGLWTGDYFAYNGEFIKFDEVKMRPVPEVPVPILVGGHSKPALRRARPSWATAGCRPAAGRRKQGNGPNHPGQPQGIRHRSEAVRDPCRRDGFDPTSIR